MSNRNVELERVLKQGPGGIDLSEILNLLKPGEDTMRWLWHLIGILEKMPRNDPFFRTVVFGSAKSFIKPGHPLYDAAYQLGFWLGQMGIDAVTGGGPGVMEAVNAGLLAGRQSVLVRSTGLSLELPSEQAANQFLSNEYHHKIFFTRLHHFARLGKVFVALPGGIGTVLEVFIIWQLLQRGHLKGLPLILVGDMWLGLIEWMKTTMVANGFVTEEEMQLVLIVSTEDLARPVIAEAHRQFTLMQAAG